MPKSQKGHSSHEGALKTLRIHCHHCGVKHALIIGVGIQILQQAGIEVLLSNMGISSASASLLICAIIYLLMLPCIAVAMRLMDLSDMRGLLLGTIPILLATLITLVVIGSMASVGSISKAAISTVYVIVYLRSFVTSFGPIPNILCSEIFPTQVRGICVAISALTFWIADIILTYSLPLILSSIGLASVFGIYAAACVISWGFVFFKVPETKGMPLEVITDLFALAAK